MTNSHIFHIKEKQRSKTLTIQSYIDSKSLADELKQAQILKIQSEIRNIKHCISFEVKMRRKKQELEKVNSRLKQFKQDATQKKKKAIEQQKAPIQNRRKQRQRYNQQLNLNLAQIKINNKERQRRVQSFLRQERQEEDEIIKLDSKSIKSHESDYLKVVKERKNLRIKTLNYDYHKNQSKVNIHQSETIKNEEYKDKRQKILQIVRRRKQYGEKPQKQALKIKNLPQIIKKEREDKSEQPQDIEIQKHRHARKKSYKPRLDTNFVGDLQQQKAWEMRKIEKEQSSTKDKLARLKNIAEGYLIKLQNGDEYALDKVSNVNLLRAKLLLKDS